MDDSVNSMIKQQFSNFNERTAAINPDAKLNKGVL